MYKLNAYYPHTNLPVLPFISFSQAYDLAALPSIPFDDIELTWYTTKQLTFMVHYADNIVYYFLVSDTLPNTEEYRRLKLELFHDIEDHHIDYYTKPMLNRFMERLNRRIHTRLHLNQMIETLQTTIKPTEIEYHKQLLSMIKQISVDDSYDRPLLQKVIQESQGIIDTEQHYRPDGKGFEEAKQDFDSLKDNTSRPAYMQYEI